MPRRHSPLWPNDHRKPPNGAVEIDWTHPLADKLVLCLLFNEAAGTPSPLGYPLILSPTSPAPTWVRSAIGPGTYYYQSATARYYYIDSTLVTAAPCTLAAVFTVITDAYSEDLISISNSATAIDAFRLNAGMATTNDPLRAVTYATTPAIGTVGTISLNTRYFGAAVFESDSSRYAVLDDTVGTRETTSRTPSGLNRIGIGISAGSSADNNLRGYLYQAYIWNRALSEYELQWIRLEPYAFLRPVIRRNYAILSEVSESVSPSRSASRSPSVSESVSPSASAPVLDGLCWGHETPDEDEQEESWQTWQVSDGVEVTVQGDPDWGDMEVADGTPCYGPVKDTGDTFTKLFTIICPKYGVNDGDVTISIRGQAASFTAFDESPDWEVYTVPVTKTWRYIQVKTEYAE